VEQKDKDAPFIPAAVLCDKQALPYARARIAKELETKPFTSRFIDTTTASPWRECYNPAHPMTRSESREWKMALLKLIQDFGLVCGSETGHEAAVPYCDYFEGMMSLGPYRVPESGREVEKIWDEVPEVVAKYQLGEKYRLPLWELVYHDCAVAQWYWGDYNNKLPALWKKRDLFNALYGTPPLYMFTEEVWKAGKTRIGESAKTAMPAARATAGARMTSHAVLTPDRSVQRTEFSNGVKVTVNFGAAPWTDADGFVVQPESARILE
jgi:hypothetical protein